MKHYLVTGPGILLAFPGKNVDKVIDKVVRLYKPSMWSRGANDTVLLNLFNGAPWITLTITERT